MRRWNITANKENEKIFINYGKLYYAAWIYFL